MKIKNIEGLTTGELENEVKRGCRLVYFPYTVSFIIPTLKLKSNLYLIRPKESSMAKGWPFLLFTVLFGWWGIPFGPRETLKSLAVIRKGGKDITDEVVSIWAGRELFREAEKEKTVYHV